MECAKVSWQQQQQIHKLSLLSGFLCFCVSIRRCNGSFHNRGTNLLIEFVLYLLFPVCYLECLKSRGLQAVQGFPWVDSQLSILSRVTMRMDLLPSQLKSDNHHSLSLSLSLWVPSLRYINVSCNQGLQRWLQWWWWWWWCYMLLPPPYTPPVSVSSSTQNGCTLLSSSRAWFHKRWDDPVASSLQFCLSLPIKTWKKSVGFECHYHYCDRFCFWRQKLEERTEDFVRLRCSEDLQQ